MTPGAVDNIFSGSYPIAATTMTASDGFSPQKLQEHESLVVEKPRNYNNKFQPFTMPNLDVIHQVSYDRLEHIFQ